MSSTSQSFLDGPGKPVSGGERAPGVKVGAGRYVLKRMLGEGGMGVVWLAEDRLLRESVALKFVARPLCLDPVALDGLRKETLKARKLSHPNIIRIHDLVDQPGEPLFITMEFVEGSNLHSLRASHPSQVLSWKVLHPLMHQLCQALAYAHGERIIHRDIKPANLMLDAQGRLKLADFGLARIASESMSRNSEIGLSSGTLDYMSPQQADGHASEVADDIYALGATFYELLTSTPPFFRGDVQYQLRHNLPQPLLERLAEQELINPLPDHVSALIMSCLSKEATARPPSAEVVLARLEAAESPVMGEGHLRGQPNRRGFQPPAGLRAAHQSGTDLDERLPAPRVSKVKLLIVIGGILLATLGSVWVGLTGPEPTSSFRPVQTTNAAHTVEAGFVSLFDGHNLIGWEGDRALWTVKDGAITAVTTEEGVKRRENTCLIWKDPVGDFELRLTFRLRDVITAKPANSGILYRARRLDNFQVRGFQADLHDEFTGTLLLLEGKDDLRTTWGHQSVINEGKSGLSVVSRGAVTPRSQFKGTVRSNDWNELVIIARGDHLQHSINGIVTADVLDRSQYAPTQRGLLALELKRATILEFKNIRLKRFDPPTQARLQR